MRQPEKVCTITWIICFTCILCYTHSFWETTCQIHPLFILSPDLADLFTWHSIFIVVGMITVKCVIPVEGVGIIMYAWTLKIFVFTFLLELKLSTDMILLLSKNAPNYVVLCVQVKISCQFWSLLLFYIIFAVLM